MLIRFLRPIGLALYICFAVCSNVAEAVRLPFSSESRTHEFYSKRLHPPGLQGTPTLALENGRVLGCVWLDEFGRTILVEDPVKNDVVVYGHIANCFVKDDQAIQKGQLIGIYGHPPIRRPNDDSILIGKVTNELVRGDDGTPSLAREEGIVLYAGWYGGYGKIVIIKNANDTSTMYAHLATCSVSQNQLVHKGQQIGINGHTGFAKGRHLVRYIVRINEDESVLTGTVSTNTF